MRLGILLSIITVVSQSVFADEPESPQPLPSAEQRAVALDLVREAYAAEYAAAGGQGAGVKLAEKLLAEAAGVEQPANRFALMAEAKRLAEQAGDVAIAMRVIDQLAGQFQLDSLLTKARCLATVVKGSSSHEVQQAVVEAAEALVEEAVAEDRYDLAAKLCEFAVANGRKARMWDAVKRLVVRGRKLNELKTRFAEVERALAVLEGQPLDAAANLTAGRYFCFVKGDWERGVTMLALGNDPQLKAVAKLELTDTDSSGQRLKVADGWWEAATGIPAEQAAPARRRAARWYTDALSAKPPLAPLLARRARSRIDEVGPIAGAVASTDGNSTSASPPSAVFTTIGKPGVHWRSKQTWPGDNWMRPGFDDSAWGVDISPYQGGDSARSDRTHWRTKELWLRRAIELSAADIGNLVIWGGHDEDVVIYANGVAVFRQGGYTGFFAEMSTEAKRALRPGANLFAVHCRDTWGGRYLHLQFARLEPQGVVWRVSLQKPADDWHAPAFSDAKWPTAPAPFGGPSRPKTGTLWPTREIWLRRAFTFPKDGLSNMGLYLHHDDDAEVYLNGVLAARVTASRKEVQAISDEALTTLKSGTNMMAVHCSNTGGNGWIDVRLIQEIDMSIHSPGKPMAVDQD